ncbi:MAG: hypothetical protein E6G72_08645 [Alphaproteobacteria bacterium]|nr:MAG: hypothetical protein E6G72_08645 [Alphaproteobacteria bacterium]
MERLTMLVTPDGEWVFPNSEEFLARLGDATPDYDAISFAVKNLGFIKFQIIRQSIIEIELHPRNVELPALLAAQQQLLQAGIKLFRVRYFDTEWHSEISSSAERTVARLSELCTPVFTPATHERFIVEPQDFGQLFHDDENQLRPLAQKWRVTFAHFDPSFISLTVRQQLLPLTAIVGVKPPTNEPVFRFIGDGHRWVGTQYRVNGIGEKVENLPDRDYGGWVAEFYRSVASSGQPRYDVVTAAMQYEDEAGKPRRLVRYERLMLPWKTPSDEIFVSSCAIPLGTAADAEAEADFQSRDPERSVVRYFARSS